MTASSQADHFFTLVAKAVHGHTLSRITLSKYRGEEPDLQRVQIRPVTLRNENCLTFVYTYKTRDITKNLAIAEALLHIEALIQQGFRNAHCFTLTEEIQLDISKKGKCLLHTRSHIAAGSSATATVNSGATDITTTNNQSSEHNRKKHRFVDITRPFLHDLGVTNDKQVVIPSMSHKWKQINKFIEVLANALTNSPLANTKDKTLHVLDFGSGKGYLTFALHDYLSNTLQLATNVKGIELRADMVSLCNNAAAKLQHQGLSFVEGDVRTFIPEQLDIMIALHACDTATDYAIHMGIRSNASIIMCSPCCHKQIRPQMHSPDVLQPLLQFGVHMGQEAEMVTDTLRALLLEANGYDTKVFEFIALEHTNKNKMILAVKNPHKHNNEKVLEKISALKTFYGIQEHCLESLLTTATTR